MKIPAITIALLMSWGMRASAQTLQQPITLAAAIAQANAHNPEVIASLQSVEVARASLEQTAPPPLQIQASRGLTQDVPQGLGGLQTFSAAASQEFTPAITAQRQAASAGIRITSAELAATRRDIDRRVITAYYTLASASGVVTAALQSVQNAQAFENSARLRARVGAVGAFEVLRADVELRRVRAGLLRAQASETIARISLNVLLALPASATTAVELPPSSTQQEDLEALYRRARVVDPQIVAFQAAIDQAAAQERAARLQYVPSIAVQGGYLFQRAPGANGATSTGPAASLSFSVPLLDNGTIRGAVRQAQARQALARAQLQGRDGQLRSELEQDIAELQSAQARSSFAVASLTQAREGLRLAEFGYRRGALGILDVLSARDQLAQAQSEATQDSADLGAATARLQLSVGVPISP